MAPVHLQLHCLLTVEYCSRIPLSFQYTALIAWPSGRQPPARGGFLPFQECFFQFVHGFCPTDANGEYPDHVQGHCPGSTVPGAYMNAFHLQRGALLFSLERLFDQVRTRGQYLPQSQPFDPRLTLAFLSNKICSAGPRLLFPVSVKSGALPFCNIPKVSRLRRRQTCSPSQTPNPATIRSADAPLNTSR